MLRKWRRERKPDVLRRGCRFKLFQRNVTLLILILNGRASQTAVPVVPQSLLYAAVTADTGSVPSSAEGLGEQAGRRDQFRLGGEGEAEEQRRRRRRVRGAVAVQLMQADAGTTGPHRRLVLVGAVR